MAGAKGSTRDFSDVVELAPDDSGEEGQWQDEVFLDGEVTVHLYIGPYPEPLEMKILCSALQPGMTVEIRDIVYLDLFKNLRLNDAPFFVAKGEV